MFGKRFDAEKVGLEDGDSGTLIITCAVAINAPDNEQPLRYR